MVPESPGAHRRGCAADHSNGWVKTQQCEPNSNQVTPGSSACSTRQLTSLVVEGKAGQWQGLQTLVKLVNGTQASAYMIQPKQELA